MDSANADGPVVLYAEFTATAGHEAEVADLVAGLTAQVRAEPGNLTFEPYVERDRPRHWFVYEAYRDEAAFRAHLAADYGAVFNTRLNEVIEQDGSELTFLTRPRTSGKD